MKPILNILLLSLLMACSSTPKQSTVSTRIYKAPIFESRLEKMRHSYLEECLAPLARKEYSEKGCAFKLLTALERSNGVNFNEIQLFRKANLLFFNSVEAQLHGIVGTQNAMAKELKAKFTNPKEAMSYFRKHYELKPTDLPQKES